eukprot:2825829-Prymnesium_polylepis.1
MCHDGQRTRGAHAARTETAFRPRSKTRGIGVPSYRAELPTYHFHYALGALGYRRTERSYRRTTSTMRQTPCRLALALQPSPSSNGRLPADLSAPRRFQTR